MAKNHPLFHKFKSVVGYSIATVVIAAALAVSGVRFLLTTANLYQDEVEQLASSLLEQPVKIGSMDAKLSGLVPTLIFRNVNLLSEKTNKTLFALSRIDVGISIKDLLWKQKITPAQLTIRGLNLQVTRTVEGTYKVKGVDLDALSKSEKDEPESLLERWLLQQGQIALEESSVTWKDEQNAGLTWFFEDVNFLLKSIGERHQLLLSSKLPKTLGEEIKIAVDLVGDITSSKTWDIKAFIESKKINLTPIKKYYKHAKFELMDGLADLELWLDWNKGNINKLSGDVKLYGFSYLTEKNKPVNLKYVSGVFDSYRDKNNLWNISVDKFNYGSKKFVDESKFSLAFKYSDKVIKTVYVRANYLKLDELSKIVTDNHLLKRDIEKYADRLNIQGDMRNVYMAWENNKLHKLKADFSNVGINAWKSIPKIKLLSGNIHYKENKGTISFLSKNTVLGFPNLFRDDFKLDGFSTDILFTNTQQGMLFDVKDLITKNTDVSAITNARLWLPKNKLSPHLDFQTYVSEGDVSKTSHYLPVSIMNKSLVKWLDQGLLGGKVEKGTVIFNGKINKFPFDNKDGVFEVAVETSDTTVNYRNGWPKITNAKASGVFTGQGMTINLFSGKAAHNVIHESIVEIKSFKKAELGLNLEASGSANNAMQYLVNTPILSKAKNTINAMRLSGDVDVDIKVNIPLNNKLSKKKPLTYSGAARLNNTSLLMLEDKLDISKGTGTIFFTDEKVSSKNLTANIIGKKSKLSLTSSANYKSINVSAKGTMTPAVILKRFDIPGAMKISGSTSFNASLDFPVKTSKNKNPTFKLNSNLLGVSSILPDHFNKQKNTRQEFIFTAMFKGENKFNLGVEFDNKGSAIFEFIKSTSQTYLNKGALSVSEKKAVLPIKNILYVDGSINNFTPSKWNSALELDKHKTSSNFFKRPVVINLDKLRLLTSDEKNIKKITAASNPTKLPAFEGVIKNLYVDKLFLGRLDFKTSKRKYGLHFDEVILSENNMKLLSHGDWYFSNGTHTTNMNITLGSDDFGRMLTGLGYAAVIEKGTAKAIGKVSWKGSPAQFSFTNLNGKIQLNIKNGNIIEAEAGAGRLLGLFSLSALPRKLFGDFSDTFKSGFNFDIAQGEIRINEGNAYTTGFKIKSPVAEVIVSGRTGLVARDYENLIEVVPELGGGIAGITALLVNLPAGVGVWLLNKLTGEKFNKASTRTYQVSGSWDKPVIEQVSNE